MDGLDWLYENRYNGHISPYDNWWHWEIGIPWILNDVVILLYDVLTPEQINNYMRAIDHFTPTVDMTGANRVWKSKVVTLRGIIGKQGGKVQAGSDGLSEVFSYATSGDGFYSDGSFIQHDHYPYAGGYGADLLYHLADVLWILSGSPWDNTSPQRDHVYEWVVQTFDPVLFKGTVLESVRGREISRPFTGSLPEWPMGTGRTRIVEGLITLADLADSSHFTKISSILKHHLENGDQDILFRHLSLWAIQKAQSVLSDPTIASTPPLVGNHQFYNQDRVVHRQTGWLVDIAMHSDRIRTFEALNGENPRGWYTADGMTYLYINPEDYNFIFWSTVDPHRLPGITVDRDPSRPDGAACCALMPNSWVGGTTLEGLYGVAGMDFQQHDYSNPSATLRTSMDLRARKSWFLLDDEIVALGAGINSTSGRTIETVVENRSLNSQGDNGLVVDGVLQPSTLPYFGQTQGGRLETRFFNPSVPKKRAIAGTLDMSGSAVKRKNLVSLPLSKLPTLGWRDQLPSVNWFHLADAGGYVFPGGADLNFLREERAGRNEDINTAFYVPGNDEFDQTEKSAFWTWVREDDTHYTWTGSALQIVTQQGTLAGTINSTRNILLTESPPEDFRLTTRLTFSPSEVGQEAGLILYRDDDNYVYISSSYDDEGSSLKTVSESQGVTSTHSTDNVFGSTVYLRVDKSGDQYAMYASGDGEAWGDPIHTYVNGLAESETRFLASSVPQTRAYAGAFDTLGSTVGREKPGFLASAKLQDADRGWNLDLRMGLFAQNGTDTVSEAVAGFDYFHFEHTRNYLTVWMDHGVNPNDASYSYIVLPGKSANEVSEYSAHPDVTILANNSRVQAVKETRLGITGANFWLDTGGRAGYITAHTKATVVVREHRDGTMTVAVADPTHTQSTITVELARTATAVVNQDPTVTVLQLSPTVEFEVDVTATPGRTHTIALEVLPLDFHVFLPVISVGMPLCTLHLSPPVDAIGQAIGRPEG
jgi:regulation of enolase protein 1 (concanavalin A-like superfamily)